MLLLQQQQSQIVIEYVGKASPCMGPDENANMRSIVLGAYEGLNTSRS